jgi:hypothetical protein
MNRSFVFVLFSLVGICGGCATQQTYDVTVTNRLSEPITVWMTKARPAKGGTYETGWMPPEVAAVGNVDPAQPLGGVPVEPGQTAHTTLTGTFSGDDLAVLRVYDSVDMNMILAMNPGNADRLDLPLDPGKTDIDVVKRGNQLADVPHSDAKP